MNAHDFVKLLRAERDAMLRQYLEAGSTTAVATRIRSLGLNDEQLEGVQEVIGDVLTEAFYAVLLGLDGAASLGGVQQTYRVHGEDGELISDCGELEAEAWEQFHGSRE